MVKLQNLPTAKDYNVYEGDQIIQEEWVTSLPCRCGFDGKIESKTYD
jgi:hypothetical protein